jgi:autotransporter-associated beta strand protein
MNTKNPTTHLALFTMRPSNSRILATAVVAAVAGLSSVSAQVTKQNTTTMNTASDWSAAPTILVDGQIGGAISALNLAALTLGGDVSLRGLLFGEGMLGAMTVDASPGFTLTLGSAGLNMSGSASTNNSSFDVTINAAIAGATSPVVVKSGRTITLGGGATSLGSLSGLGTLNLTSSTSKSYTFAENQSYNMGSFSAPTTTGLQIGNNSTVSVGGTGSVQGIGSNGNGVVRVNGTNATLTMGGGSADAVVSRGTGLGILQIDNGSVSVLRNLQVGQTLTNSAARGSLIVNGGNLSVSSVLNINPSTSAAAITSQSVVEIAGGQVSASRIRLNSSSSSGHAQLTMTGGTLYLSNNGDAIDAPGTGTSTYNITLSGGVIGSSTTTASGGWSSAANMTLGTTNGDITFQSANATSSSRNITLSGQLSGSGGLIKTGAGNLTLSGANSYTGNTTVSQGTLALSGTGSITNSANLVIGNGAGAQFNVNGLSAGSVSLSNAITFTLGATSGSNGLFNASTKAFSYNSQNITFDFSTGLAAGSYTYDLFDFASQSGSLNSIIFTGGYSGSTNWATLTGSGFTVGDSTFTFNAGNGVLSVTAIPEPSTYALGILGVLSLILVARRRRRHTVA